MRCGCADGRREGLSEKNLITCQKASISRLTLNTQESRVNVLLRLVGLIILALGGAMTYLTYVEGSQASIVPQIVPVFYLIALLLMIVGIIAVVTKYK
jgi:hypothetical protein